MNVTDTRTAIILEALQNKHDSEVTSSYGEQGYTDPAKGIIFANWNNISRQVQDYLELAGYELEWCDEWVIDYNNAKAYRISPDSYGWICQVAHTENGELLTPDDDDSDWIDYVSNNTRLALPDRITEESLNENGFTKLDADFQNGWYNRADCPAEITDQLRNDIENLDRVVFQIADVGQFHTNFTVFYSTHE